MKRKKGLAFLFDRSVKKIRQNGFSGLFSYISDRISKNVQNKLAFYGFGTPRLQMVCLELTSDCNLGCKMCFSAKYRETNKPRYIKLEDCKRILNELALLKCSLALNFSGESTLHPDFKEIIKYASSLRSLGLKSVGFITNGMLFDEEIAKVCVKAKVDNITFSLNGIGKVNDDWRVGADYQVISDNIKQLISLRDKNTVPRVEINLIDFGNKQANNEFLKAWLPIVDAIEVSPLQNPQRKTAYDNFFDDSEFCSVKVCPFPSYFMGILANGQATTCCADDNAELNLGNVIETSVKDVWYNTKYSLLRRNLRKDKPSGICCGCNFWSKKFISKISITSDFEVLYSDWFKFYSKHYGTQNDKEIKN